MLHLSWQLARNVKITDRRLFEYIKYVLMHSLKQCQLAINYIENCGCELKHQARLPDEPAHYCYDCDAEVFNILFISEQPLNSSTNERKAEAGAAGQTQHVVHCQACARKRNHLLDNFVILSQYELNELKNVYDQFQLYVANTNVQGILNSMNNPANIKPAQAQMTISTTVTSVVSTTPLLTPTATSQSVLFN
jgi:histone demethylase